MNYAMSRVSETSESNHGSRRSEDVLENVTEHLAQVGNFFGRMRIDAVFYPSQENYADSRISLVSPCLLVGKLGGYSQFVVLLGELPCHDMYLFI